MVPIMNMPIDLSAASRSSRWPLDLSDSICDPLLHDAAQYACKFEAESERFVSPLGMIHGWRFSVQGRMVSDFVRGASCMSGLIQTKRESILEWVELRWFSFRKTVCNGEKFHVVSVVAVLSIWLRLMGNSGSCHKHIRGASCSSREAR